MVNYQIAPNQYVLPTPGGAYYAVSSPVVEPAWELLFRLFQEDHTPRLTAEQVQAWGEEETVTLELIFRMQSLALRGLMGESRILANFARILTHFLQGTNEDLKFRYGKLN